MNAPAMNIAIKTTVHHTHSVVADRWRRGPSPAKVPIASSRASWARQAYGNRITATRRYGTP
jgi:hypothetical protein